jgi:AcrR family transcriptional regulator
MKDSIRQKIVEKARDLLFTKTEEEITMNLVANELSITAPTLYHYFKGKGEMLEAANQLIVNEISSTLELKFPPSIPFEMRIITAVAMTGDYFMKTGLPASYLIEDPRERPIVLGEFRKKLAALCAEYKKSGKNKNKLPAEQMAYRLLSCIAADIAFYRNSKKALPEDFAEKIWESVN